MEDIYYTCTTKEPVKLVKGIKNNTLLKIIEALLWGVTVKIGDIKLRLAPAIGGGYSPVMITNEDKKLIMGFEDMTFSWLSSHSERMTIEEYEDMLFDLASSKTITENNRR